MELFIAVCGFFGAWLLVAGPVYQAALELKGEYVEQEHLDQTRQKIERVRISPWWWLLPPVKIILEQRQNRGYRAAFMAALPDEDVEILVSFMNKATGWLFVASGGFLLALKETYELAEHFGVNLAWFWIIVFVMTLLCVGNTAVRIARSERVLSN